MKLPFDRIKVGAFYPRVRLSDHLLSDTPAYGYTDRVKGEIVIDSSLRGTRLAETFWHEVKHCLWAYSGADNDPQSSALTIQSISEEQLISRSSFMEVTFWHDNPEVLKWWTKLLREK